MEIRKKKKKKKIFFLTSAERTYPHACPFLYKVLAAKKKKIKIGKEHSKERLKGGKKGDSNNNNNNKKQKT